MSSWALLADPGVDDAIAMAVLAGLGAVPDVVVAVPGNVGIDLAARNAAGLASMFGWSVPVRTWDGPVRRREGSVHGDDGLGGQAHRLPVAAPPSPVDDLPGALLVTGPLSAVTGPVERLVWMGGALDGVEFNAWCDPAAADLVLGDHAGVTQLVPLDVTARVHVGADEFCGLVADAQRATGRTLVHDAVAAVAWLWPELFDWQPRSLRCDPDGRLLPADDRPPVRVALDADVEAVRSTIREAVAACG